MISPPPSIATASILVPPRSTPMRMHPEARSGGAGAEVRSEPDANAGKDGAPGNDRHVVRLTALVSEEVLTRYFDRESLAEIARSGGAEPGRAVIPSPEGAQWSADVVADWMQLVEIA